jgi:hypothetical protein
MPWVLSQSQPLSTSSVMAEAKKRGVDLDALTLRELYRRGDFAPIAEITARRVRAGVSVSGVPAAGGGMHAGCGWPLLRVGGVIRLWSLTALGCGSIRGGEQIRRAGRMA